MNHYTGQFQPDAERGFLDQQSAQPARDGDGRRAQGPGHHQPADGHSAVHAAGAATTPFELSRLLGIDTGLMTRMLDKLEAKGLLERSRSIEDRRVVNLKLTKAGEAVAARLPEIVPVVLNSA